MSMDNDVETMVLVDPEQYTKDTSCLDSYRRKHLEMESRIKSLDKIIDILLWRIEELKNGEK